MLLAPRREASIIVLRDSIEIESNRETVFG